MRPQQTAQRVVFSGDLGAPNTPLPPAPRPPERADVLVLIASLAAILLWLIGTAAERCGAHERLRPGSRKRRAYSRLFLARLLLTLEDCRTTIAELVDAIGPLDQWVASDHDALLVE